MKIVPYAISVCLAYSIHTQAMNIRAHYYTKIINKDDLTKRIIQAKICIHQTLSSRYNHGQFQEGYRFFNRKLHKALKVENDSNRQAHIVVAATDEYKQHQTFDQDILDAQPIKNLLEAAQYECNSYVLK